MTDTDTTDNSLVELEDPLTGEKFFMTQEKYQARQLAIKAIEEQREELRKRLVAIHSTSPIYQARAERDPEYWDKFYLGRVK